MYPARHPASLLPAFAHSPELLRLLEIKISAPVIEHVVDCVYETAAYALMHSGVIISKAFPARRPRITAFVSAILSRAEVTTPTLLVALVYIVRARPHLYIALEEWSLERVFIGALILASKYTQDSTLRNVHWAACTGIFGKHDVGRIEREFLEVLDWELGVREADLMQHCEALVRPPWWAFVPAKQREAFLAVPPPAYGAHTHTHRRHLSVECPSLEPSSPHSSLSVDISSPSPSPQTPPVLAVDSYSHSYPTLAHPHAKPTVVVPVPVLDPMHVPVPVPTSVHGAAPVRVPAKKAVGAIPSSSSFSSSSYRTFLRSLPFPLHSHNPGGPTHRHLNQSVPMHLELGIAG